MLSFWRQLHVLHMTSIQSFYEEKLTVFIVHVLLSKVSCLILCLIQCGMPFFRNHNVDVSVAVSAESGLITPIVFNADKKARKKRLIRSFCLIMCLGITYGAHAGIQNS